MSAPSCIQNKVTNKGTNGSRILANVCNINSKSAHHKEGLSENKVMREKFHELFFSA